MDIKKILIWNTFELLERQGGPSSYLYNLRKSAIDNNIETLVFLDDYKIRKKKSKLSVFFKKRIKPLIEKKENRKNKIKVRTLKNLTSLKDKLPDNIVLSDYGIIHFHTTFDYYRNRELLRDFKGKVLLTTHSPKATHKEIFEEWLLGISLTIQEKEQIEAIDNFAFTNADYIIFPCIEAQEPYLNSWNKYKNLKFKNEIKELITCTLPSLVLRSREDVRKEYNIPNDAYVITYFGRHIEVKGYALLKEAAEKILNTHNNIYVLIAGKEEPMQGLENDRWIEVGWTNDPHSIAAAADLFVLPNKETYFDLSLLEVLSIGVRCLISNTGGNNYFKRFDAEEINGIHYFNSNDVDSLVNEINVVYDSKNNLTNNNKQLFQNYFHYSTFAPNYIEIVNKLK